MATDFAVGDRVIPRTLLAAFSSHVLQLLEQPPIEGYVYDITADQADVLWNNEEVSANLPVDSAAIPAISLLKVSAPTSTALQGKVVRRTAGSNQSAEFIGAVFALFGVELTPGTPATIVQVAVARTPSGMYWLNEVAGLAVVAGS